MPHCDEILVSNPPADMQNLSESESDKSGTEGEYYE